VNQNERDEMLERARNLTRRSWGPPHTAGEAAAQAQALALIVIADRADTDTRALLAAVHRVADICGSLGKADTSDLRCAIIGAILSDSPESLETARHFARRVAADA
jgi:hypothetical protein